MFEKGESGDPDGENTMTPQPDPGHPVAGEESGAPEGAQAQETAKIGEQDQKKGQTAHPAPEDDVGAPSHHGGSPPRE